MPTDMTLVQISRAPAPPTVFRFHGRRVCTDGKERSSGWAVVAIHDDIGLLTIASDWTDALSYLWGTHAGNRSLVVFLAECNDVDYVAKKLLPTIKSQEFDADATIDALQATVLRRRLEHGRAVVHPSTAWILSRERARAIWDWLEEMRGDHHSADLFIERMSPDIWNLTDGEDFLVYRPTWQSRSLRDFILPGLFEACKAEVKRRCEARLKDCTCSVVSCRGVDGLGELWRCQKTGEPGRAKAQGAQPECAVEPAP